MKYASFGQRFVAAGLDGIVSTVIIFIVLIPLPTIEGLTGWFSLSQSTYSTLGWLVGLVYFVYLTGRSGQTIGKRWMKIKVVKITENKPPTYGRALLRESLRKWISGIVFGLGYFWMFWDNKKQTWHDKFARTIVVSLK